MKFSKELTQMLSEKVGFRNEAFRGSGERIARDVIKFEMYDLGNEDIVEFFREHYGFSIPYESYQKALENEEITEAEVDQIIDQMFMILKEKFGHTNLYCLWLTSLEGVKENYMNEEDMEEDEIVITKYYLPDKVVPISDLEDEGALFVMEIHPDMLETEDVFLGEKPKDLVLPWLLTKEEFESQSIPSEEATKLVQTYRAGNKHSKNKGKVFEEPETGDLVETLLPISVFSEDYLNYIEETVDMNRVNIYRLETIHTPIYALPSPKGSWILSDGGHRLIAKRLNREPFIRALVPKSSHKNLVQYAIQKGWEVPFHVRSEYSL
jgi:hypothetical protein